MKRYFEQAGYVFASTEITSASPKAGKPAAVCTLLLLSVL